MKTWLTETKILFTLTLLVIIGLIVFYIDAYAQSTYVTQSVAGNVITFKNVSGRPIDEMSGDLLESGQVVGIYKHTFLVYGFQPNATESMTIQGQKAPSVALKYVHFVDGTSWSAPVSSSLVATATSGQTLNIDLTNSYCKANTFTPGFTLHGTWRNTTTGCTATGNVEKQSPYACGHDPSYGYPDLALRTCKAGVCCTIQYTALRPTISADTDCLSTGNGFYTGVSGDQTGP